MAFDISTAKPIETRGFDISTAKPINQPLNGTEAILTDAAQQTKNRIAESNKNPFGRFMNKATDYLMPTGVSDAEFKPGEQNIWGDVLSRPGKAIEGAIFPKPGESRIAGYQRAAATPETQPSGQESLNALEPPTGNKFIDTSRNVANFVTGNVIDVATQPANYMGGIIGKFLGKTPEAQKAVTSLMDEIKNMGISAESKIKNVGESIGQAIKTPLEKGIQTFKTLRGENQGQITANIGKIKSEIDSLKSAKDLKLIDMDTTKLAQAKFLNDQMDTAKKLFSENKKVLLNKLDKAATTGTIDTRKVLQEMNRASSKIWGKTTDMASDFLATNNEEMTAQEFTDIYKNTIQAAKEGTLPASNMQSFLGKMAEKFKIRTTPLGDLMAENPDDVISLKELQTITKTMNKSLSTGATPDDAFIGNFKDEYGKWLAEKAKKYPELNNFVKLSQEYAPIVQLKRETNNIFKPYDIGKYKLDTGVRLLRQFGLSREGDLAGQKNLLKAIEKGFKFQGQQVGGRKGIYTDVESLGKTFQGLVQEKDNLINTINQRLDTMKFTDATQKLSIRKELANRIEKLNADKIAESIKLQNRTNADKLLKRVIWAGLGASGVGYGGKKALDVLSR